MLTFIPHFCTASVWYDQTVIKVYMASFWVIIMTSCMNINMVDCQFESYGIVSGSQYTTPVKSSLSIELALCCMVLLSCLFRVWGCNHLYYIVRQPGCQPCFVGYIMCFFADFTQVGPTVQESEWWPLLRVGQFVISIISCLYRHTRHYQWNPTWQQFIDQSAWQSVTLDPFKNILTKTSLKYFKNRHEQITAVICSCRFCFLTSREAN